ncbi:MAG: bifunctional proline dehydrogenase/L-glutamate gamma-semialdehyde dehydrogenase PutA [Alphaproteobacteria bacterium]|nr:bifunctional proline dehydrogenase/L-glutamate gamma-semialdehyde dehydrogenase PutA [Alphaproteobacteria bacterium]
MIFATPQPEPTALVAAMRARYRADETAVVEALLDYLNLPAATRKRIEDQAAGLVTAMRESGAGKGGIDAFMGEYGLSSAEGIVLMCLAEALLRIPDAETAEALIRDKLADADWQQHLGHSQSLFVNASTWALMLTGRVIQLAEEIGDEEKFDLADVMGRMVGRVGEPVIRQAVTQAMRIMGRQFVLGRTIEEALDRAREDQKQGYRHSYDMLGEAARTMADAERYYDSYAGAIQAIGQAADGAGVIDGPGISVKLTALHPRYEFAQWDRAIAELVPRVVELAVLAKAHDLGFTVDAEEADRLEISLEVFAQVAASERLKGWDGLGLAVQAYQKRALPQLDWLDELAERTGRRLMVRLVKGAYWDTEVKRAQERGLDGYPVFTRKSSTDVSFLACVKRLFAAPKAFYPQFATHNAHSLAAIVELAGNSRAFEFQRLHGMGEDLYEHVVGADKLNLPCRIYAPVGSHEDLLAYLVRRLLENGANTSFVNRITDAEAPVSEIVADPIEKTRTLRTKPHPRIALPADMYQPDRRNSFGPDLSDVAQLAPLAEHMRRFSERGWEAAPIVGGKSLQGAAKPVTDPSDNRRQVGSVVEADAAQVEDALARAHAAAGAWDATPADQRAACLERFADLLEANMGEAMAVCTRDAGKSIMDGVNEAREAADFCRYYAARARSEFAGPHDLPGPTGESNAISLHGRGVFACISPWNFPLAIFTGQVSAALAAGNAVLAKPAEQTPLVAAFAVRLMHEAGIPGDVIQLLPGDGPTVGARLTADPRIAGVAFTGSTETAKAINKTLAERDGPIVPLIAETGGQNALIVDSSALPEQVVTDVIASSFNSAGQRCSACRVLFVQSDIAEKVITMLTGAMEALSIGDPALLSTDVGPVIDAEAKGVLDAHAARMKSEARLLYECPLPDETAHGTFVAPAAFELDRLDRLEREVFGPILHVIRFAADKIDRVVEDINRTGYGLTFGVHSRIDSNVRRLHRQTHVGNTYVNRNIIGAVVGVQPFGGEGLSGTGPKAGGPHYLHRFATERVLTINTTATGGNASLLSLQDDEDV